MKQANEPEIDLTPGTLADSPSETTACLSPAIRRRYDVYSYRHAASILKHSFPGHLKEIEQALAKFSISLDDIAKPGGNESDIPKRLASILRPHGWNEVRIQGDLTIRVSESTEELLSTGSIKKHPLPNKETVRLENYIDGHKIDFVKGRVALDIEWNSKDQTFDRDLYAFRMFHECGVISAAVLVTRSVELNEIFKTLPLKKKDGTMDTAADGTPKMCGQKYGASTTWMGKLLYRLNAGRHGGCPVLVFGIRPEVVVDWKKPK